FARLTPICKSKATIKAATAGSHTKLLSATAVADPNITGAIAAGSVRGRAASIQASIFERF
ncbi:MAG: hypothetical protein KAR15_09390, partial [Desulfobacterales bacterium]|nr:hypothetical protein [Desulfobacterales bacterium]